MTGSYCYNSMLYTFISICISAVQLFLEYKTAVVIIVIATILLLLLFYYYIQVTNREMESRCMLSTRELLLCVQINKMHHMHGRFITIIIIITLTNINVIKTFCF